MDVVKMLCLAAAADLDQNSLFPKLLDLDKVNDDKQYCWSVLLPGLLTLTTKEQGSSIRYGIIFEESRDLITKRNKGWCGAKFSELTVNDNQILTFDN